MTKLLLRLAAVIAVGVGASACSSVPAWVDPTTWVDNGPADQGQAPDLADIPGKPASSTPDDQRQVADSLAADRARANYSAEALKADAEPAAPPPPPPPPPGATAETTSTAAAGTDTQVAADAPADAAAEPAAEAAPSAPSAVPTTKVASAEPSTSLPARSPQMPVAPAAASPESAADASLGFRPSSAPPLDPSVAQFVSPALVHQYERANSLNPNDEATDRRAPASSRHRHRHTKTASADGMGGPESMGGDVVANMDAVPATPGPSPAAYTDQNGNTPAAVIFFPGDGTSVSSAAREKLRQVVKEYQAKGDQGFIKVVGHSSSRTRDMPIEKHLAFVFKRSQDRANAVAHELIREGIPADKVLVDAVGDSQPVYYESMPAGEEGNRRAEVFLQS